MKIRFVQGSGLISQAIVAQSKTAMPFTPSHVETISEDGLSYIGAHIKDGIQARPIGYDKDTTLHGLILDLPANLFSSGSPFVAADKPKQDRLFWDFMQSKIGEPYDWHAIVGFVVPAHEHVVNTAICSAIATLALRHCFWFPDPLAVPAHLISPRDLLLMVSARMPVPGI